MDKLPQGIKSVDVEDWGVGDLLVVRMTNGRTIVIEALQLAEHTACVTLLERSEDDTDFDPLAAIDFNAEGDAGVRCYPRKPAPNAFDRDGNPIFVTIPE